MTTIERIALFFLTVFALSITLSVSGIDLALAALTVTTAVAYRHSWPYLRATPLTWIVLLTVVWLLVGFLTPPGFAIPFDEQLDEFRTYLRLSGLPVLILGLWLAQCHRHIPIIFGAAAVALVVQVAISVDLGSVQDLSQLRKHSMGLGGSNSPGTFGAVALVGCLTVGRTLFESSGKTTSHCTVSRAIALLLVLFSLFLAIINEARAAWVGIAAAIPVALLLLYVRSNRPSVVELVRNHKISVVIGVTAVGMLCALLMPILLNRLVADAADIMAVLRMDFDELTPGSIGSRVAMVEIAMRELAGHPLTGIGYGALDSLVTADAHDLISSGHPHVHNAFLQVVATLGVPGFLLMITQIALLLVGAIHSLTSDQKNIRRLGEFAIIAGTVLAVVSLFQIRHDQPAGRALIMGVMACAAACLPAFRRQESAVLSESCSQDSDRNGGVAIAPGDTGQA